MVLDYSKWDGVGEDGEEGEPQVTPQTAPFQELPAANVEGHAFLRKHFTPSSLGIDEHRTEELLRFLREQDAGDAQSNVTRCNAICAFLLHCPRVATKESLDILVRFTRRVTFGELPDAPPRTMPILLSGVNTLAACVEEGAVRLYSIISAPKDEESIRMRTRYERREYARHCIMSSLGWKATDPNPANEDESGDPGGGWCTLS
mmetsp:Transcript_11396/g.38853  ORF Transcript_11396/g.38853 Transcript_11396/m.38853 type:complete len:204 (-) Transcript_11396:144-755(-)|eukprot:CAMPEP_0206001378 /NCGR_PEP_ID=MMETSP1464-20131121/2072_1 /ASSEMBLY_ACC=CAM_ASM_001124 /TAXON_ID=119497 /ORGANISM="Exanthemachrysis gayraliae, Strain RCC1523" /LENGTH=203 /DNA_ID=CAMNT_0053374687 /DNA_START=34 /DNA_END=645 /DNA_ORIENTATION=-